MGPGILQRQGADGEPQDLCAQVWTRQLHHQKMLPSKTRRFVGAGHLLCLQHVRCFSPTELSLFLEQSNLLVVRKGDDQPVNDFFSPNVTQLRFHQIKDKDIVQVMTPHRRDTT